MTQRALMVVSMVLAVLTVAGQGSTGGTFAAHPDCLLIAYTCPVHTRRSTYMGWPRFPASIQLECLLIVLQFVRTH